MACSTPKKNQKYISYDISVENQKSRNHMVYLGLKGSIMLKWILGK